MSNNQNSKFQIRLPLFLALGISAGILIGATMADTGSKGSSLNSNVLKFREILNYVSNDYVDEVDTDKLAEEAISKMLEKLDPHTVYIPSEERELSQSQLEGAFEGIGIEFNILKDTIYVVAPLSGGPSEKIGIMSGDKIVAVDNENVAGIGITNRDVFKKLRGKKGSEVVVSIKRRNETEVLDFNIIRDKIPQYSVDVSYMVDDQIGYIKISRFAATTYDEFMKALQSLEEQGMERLVLDLQGNVGGYMDKAIKIADEFIDGTKMIVYTDGKENRYDSEARAKKTGQFEDGPLIVLIDEGSASASEIVAGALQDNDRALIVGRRSFGKGLVQMPISLNDGSELRLTISRYYTPSGRSIQKSYEDGEGDYRNDIAARFENGEFFHADSVKFDDSLRFETAKGRDVYGGGGIMPDFFVSIDTSQNTTYYRRLLFSNAVREYTLNYAEDHRAKLEKMELEEYVNDFNISDKMLKDLTSLAAKSDIKLDEAEFFASKDLIKTHVKAQIARSIWDNEGYYPIMNKYNEVFQKAIGLFEEANELAFSN